MKLADLATGSDWIVWIVFVIFAVLSIILLSGHFIYGGAQELSTSQAAKDLELTPTSISRASRQLEEMGLLHIRKVGVQRIMQSEDSPKTLFQKAGDKLLNPIKRTIYIPKEFVGTDLLESGYSALALRKDADERVEEMLNELWRKIDGDRN